MTSNSNHRTVSSVACQLVQSFSQWSYCFELNHGIAVLPPRTRTWSHTESINQILLINVNMNTTRLDQKQRSLCCSQFCLVFLPSYHVMKRYLIPTLIQPTYWQLLINQKRGKWST